MNGGSGNVVDDSHYSHDSCDSLAGDSGGSDGSLH